MPPTAQHYTGPYENTIGFINQRNIRRKMSHIKYFKHGSFNKLITWWSHWSLQRHRLSIIYLEGTCHPLLYVNFSYTFKFFINMWSAGNNGTYSVKHRVLTFDPIGTCTIWKQKNFHILSWQKTLRAMFVTCISLNAV